MGLTDDKIKFLEKKANEIRQDIIKMLVEAGSGHSAGPLGMADVFTALYFGDILKYDSKNPKWEERDYLLLSNGHICPVMYAAMAHAGYFPREELMTLRKFGTRLQGHPHNESLAGIEITSGPLGSGLGQAAGMAYGLKMPARRSLGEGGDKKKNQVYCLGSDGEHDTGVWWESVLWAGKLKLDNLTVIVDRNNIQIDGYTEDVLPLEPLRAKYESFNWHVIEIDGHNFQEIIGAVNQAKAIFEKPVVIITHTIPGKGVDFMEYDFNWHGKPPNQEEAKKALSQLRTLGGKMKSEHE